MKQSRLNRFSPLLVVLAVASLAGCAPESGGRASDSPSESPTPTPVTTATLQVARDGITILGSDGSTLQTVLYKSDPVDAIAAITTRLGEAPATETFAATACSYPLTTARWGRGFSLTYVTDDQSGAAKMFTVRSNSATTSGDVSVETAQGFSVGDPVKDLIAKNPNAVTQGEDDPSVFGIRVFFDLDSDQNGVVADSDPKTLLISIIYAPANVNQDC
ncbi:hypothetical protein [Lacisediminihabitans sp.]|uniref:hypothetical protein n=1 Tax=Lacisediminihabitans sp. TaxID=2787631 RepID=UPI00374DB57B